MKHLHLALNQSEEEALHDVAAIAMNMELAGGAAPEWVELIPAGPIVRGRDGRVWTFDEEGMESILVFFEEGTTLNPAPIDWEHATETRAPEGKEAPAAGWIDQLEDRGGALWGHVDWTPRAKAQIEAKEYRSLSPVFYFTKDGHIRALKSVGLTNNPNLHLTALNRGGLPNLEDHKMDPKLLALCKRIGLDPASATPELLDSAVAELESDLATARNQQIPSELCTLLGLNQITAAGSVVAKVEEQINLAKAANSAALPAGTTLLDVAPKADLDLALNRAKVAETKVAEIETKQLEADIETAVNQAIMDGKIAPGSKDYHLSTCKQEGGLEAFQEYAKNAAQIIKDPKLPVDPTKPSGKSGLSDEELGICKNLGLDPEEYAKANGKEGDA